MSSDIPSPPPRPDDGPLPQADARPGRDRRSTVPRIRVAARRLFLERGYEGTSMDAVAAAAPVSKRTLYQHFPAKAELFAAVIDDAWSYFTRSPALPGDTTGDPREVLRAYVGRLTDHWDRPDVVPLLRLVIAEAPRFPELSQAYFAVGKEPALRGLGAYFAALAAEDRLAADDPQLAAAQFLGAIKEPLFWPRVLGVPVAFDPAAAVERAIDAALKDG